MNYEERFGIMKEDIKKDPLEIFRYGVEEIGRGLEKYYEKTNKVTEIENDFVRNCCLAPLHFFHLPGIFTAKTYQYFKDGGKSSDKELPDVEISDVEEEPENGSKKTLEEYGGYLTGGLPPVLGLAKGVDWPLRLLPWAISSTMDATYGYYLSRKDRYE